MSESTRQPAFTVEDWDKNAPQELNIERNTDGDTPTADDLNFLERIWILHTMISRLAAADRQPHFYQQVHGAAEVGLQAADLPTGSAILRRIEREFVEVEGPLLRQRFLGMTLAWGTGLFLLAVIVAASSGGCGIAPGGCIGGLIFDVAWVAAGIGMGMIFFAYVSSIDITYDNIGRFDPSVLGPPLRLGFIAVVATALCVLLLSGTISIGFGQFQLNDFRSHSIVAFLLGFFAAYSDVQTARLISTVLDRGAAQRT